MEQPSYTVDPDDPRAPPQDVWDRLDPHQRQRVVDALPSEFSWAAPPEGDPHRRTKETAFQTLEEHFRRRRRSIYLSSELPVYYPNEPVFAPDIIAVLDVDAHERHRWVVSDEGRGIDFALEVNVRGRRRKDLERNVELFARLKIPEYFVFEVERTRLQGWRLQDERYVPIVPQAGRWRSAVLGLELAIDGRSLCFYEGSALLLDMRGLVNKLSAMVDAAVARAEEEAQRAEQEAQRAEQEAQRAEQEAQRAEQEAQRAERFAAKLRNLGVDPDSLE